MDEKVSKDERIGFHKGAINTLLGERNELMRIIGITENLIDVHAKELKKMGVEIKKEGEKS